ncbi:hypothetical protein F4703DRAFT_1903080 [Phycomyces blakesleeanus]
MSKICEVLQYKKFNCFSLQRGLIPFHMTIYTCILNILILNNSVIRHLDKEAVWGSVMNINSKATRTQGEAKDVKYWRKKLISLMGNEFRYIETLEEGELQAIKKFRKLRNDMKLNHIIAAKLFLSQHNSSTTTKEKIINYLQEKAKAIPAMKAYYANEGNPA